MRYKRKKYNTGGAIGAGLGAGATSFIPGIGPALAPIGGKIGQKIGGMFDSEPEEPRVVGRAAYASQGFKYGGNMKRKYATGGNIPTTQPIGPDAVKYDGPPHEQGGIPIDDRGEPTSPDRASAEVEGNETRQGDYIFSDELIVPETDMTFAQMHEMLLEEGAGKEEIEQLAQMQEEVKQSQGIDDGGAEQQMQQEPPMQEPMPEEGMPPMQEDPMMDQAMPPMMKKGGNLKKYPYGGGLDQLRNHVDNMAQRANTIQGNSAPQTNPAVKDLRDRVNRSTNRNLNTNNSRTSMKRVPAGTPRPIPGTRKTSNVGRFARGVGRLGSRALGIGSTLIPERVSATGLHPDTYEGVLGKRQLPGLGGQQPEPRTGLANPQIFPNQNQPQPRGLLNTSGRSDRDIFTPQTGAVNNTTNMQNVEAPVNSGRPASRPSARNNAPQDVVMEPNPNDVLYGRGVGGSRNVEGQTFNSGQVTTDPMNRGSNAVEGGRDPSGGRSFNMDRAMDVASYAIPSAMRLAMATTAPDPEPTQRAPNRRISTTNPAFRGARNRQGSAFRANPNQAGHAQYTQGVNQIAGQEAQFEQRAQEVNQRSAMQADRMNMQADQHDNQAQAQADARRMGLVAEAVEMPINRYQADKRGRQQEIAQIITSADRIQDPVDRNNAIRRRLKAIGLSDAEVAERMKAMKYGGKIKKAI